MDGWNRGCGDDPPCADDNGGKREALIERCVQMYFTLKLGEEFRYRHQQATADLYRAAHMPMPMWEYGHVAWEATNHQLNAAKEILRDLGLSEDEITQRFFACYQERAYPIYPDSSPRPPLMLRLRKAWHAAVSRACRLVGRTPPDPPKGGQRDLYH